MNNKYIGNRPVKVTKSNWKDRALESEQNKVLPSDFQANKGKETNKICTNFKYVSPYWWFVTDFVLNKILEVMVELS